MTRTALYTLIAIAVGCVSGAAPAQTQPIHPKMFDTPQAAAQALITAAGNDNTNELTEILGSSAKGILTSGNAAQDQVERREFSKLAMAKNQIEPSSMDNNMAVVVVGFENWPFPIPLVKTGQEWHFDPQKGAVEVRARRIGADELDAIEICTGYVAAQENYARQNPSKGGPAYAETIMSSPGTGNGLYRQGDAKELVPEGFAMADAGSPDHAKKPYHGYYFRVLKQQGPDAAGGAYKYTVGGAMIGGFALIAWPAEYGETGIHTFIVNQDGVVFEKDLGSRTAALAAATTTYEPDNSWTPVD